jgi:hypothetical protein
MEGPGNPGSSGALTFVFPLRPTISCVSIEVDERVLPRGSRLGHEPTKIERPLRLCVASNGLRVAGPLNEFESLL